jgi:hypothetical protein
MTAAAIAMADMNDVGAAVVAGVDAPPVLELAEHVFDLVAREAERAVLWDLDLAVGLRRDSRSDAALG